MNCGIYKIQERTFFSHLIGHLKNYETVKCPFKNGNFKTNVLTTFRVHKNRKHKNHSVKDFRLSLLTGKKAQLEDLNRPFVESEETPIEICYSDISPIKTQACIVAFVHADCPACIRKCHTADN